MFKKLLEWLAAWWNGTKPQPQPDPPPPPPPEPPPITPPPEDPIGRRLVLDLFIAHNKEREKAGLNALTANDKLFSAAAGHAAWMATNRDMDHNQRRGTPGFTGVSFVDRAEAQGFGIRAGGENIAAGQKTIEAVMKAWMNSPGHRENILNRSFLTCGLGIARTPGGVFYWCAVFATQPGVRAAIEILYRNCPPAIVEYDEAFPRPLSARFDGGLIK